MKKALCLALLILLYGTAHAQSLDLVFESPPGAGPSASLFSIIGTYIHRDANGDGTADLVLQRLDAQGRLQDLRALDGATQEVLWEMPNIPSTLSLSGQDVFFHGFPDLLGVGTPQALFSSDTEVLTVNLDDNSVSFRTLAPGPSVLLGVTDVTGDAIDDLLLALTETEQVQVWSVHD